jgi:hypothetical protein
MSVNRVLNGTTKKQQNTQGQEKFNCLKIDKRCKWVRYLTQQKEITMADTYNNERLKRIKEEIKNTIKGNIHQDVESSITNMIMNPNKGWMAMQENPLSNITKLQNIWRGRTNVGISTSKETKYSQRVQNIQTLNSYVENITRAGCGHMKIPKHLEST